MTDTATDTATDQTTDESGDDIIENRGSPITTREANLAISNLMKLVPTGGSKFGFSSSFVHSSVGTTVSEDGSWRIDVTFEVPRRATLLSAWLASWGVEAAKKRIQFVVRADQQKDTEDGGDGETTPTQIYTVLNGDFPNQIFTQRDPKPQNFRDKGLQDLYGAGYATTIWDNALKVIRSELTGEKAFEDSPK